MSLKSFYTKPLAAAVLGAIVAAPLSALYALTVSAQSPAHTMVAPTQAAPAAGNPAAVLPDFSSMVKSYGPAVVNIQVVEKTPAALTHGDENAEPGDDSGGGAPDDNPFGNTPFAPFFKRFQPPQQQPLRGEGSGFIVSADGLILTNAHVVNGAKEVTVRLTDRREFTAKVVGVDTRSDVAVIRIPAKNLPTVKVGDSRNVQVGEWVLAIGAPFGFANSATAGIVSATGRTLPGSGYVPFIQTDVPINPGNSGGPLFNMRGEVIGINSQIYSRSGGYQGVAFSIPISVAMNVSHQLQTSGHVSRGKLGVAIQNVNQSLADSFGLPQPEGALVASVEKDSPASRAGIQPGDVILKLNGAVVNESQELPAEIAEMSPGSTVKLEVWRQHASRTLEVKLGQMEDTRTAANIEKPHSGGKLGLAVRPLTSDEQHQAGTKGGLLVEKVSGPAAEAGLQQGDIVLSANGARVTSAADLIGAVEKSKGHIALLVQRGDAQIFIPVRVG